MAATVQVTEEIAADPERVWSLVSDVTRMGEWSPENEGGEWRRGARGPAVGAAFRGANRHQSKRWTTMCTVTASEPGRSFAFRVKVGPLRVAEWRYELAATPAGCTVTESFADERGGLVKLLGRLTTGVEDRESHNRDTMTTTLARLKAAAEGPKRH
jgi:uncharacterized protein YndB with AHSA1/START domain